MPHTQNQNRCAEETVGSPLHRDLRIPLCGVALCYEIFKQTNCILCATFFMAYKRFRWNCVKNMLFNGVWCAVPTFLYACEYLCKILKLFVWVIIFYWKQKINSLRISLHKTFHTQKIDVRVQTCRLIHSIQSGICMSQK